MTWQVEIKDRARRELRALDPQIQDRILIYLRKHIETIEDPRRFGKALTSDKSGLWRYRVGDYRIICEITDTKRTFLRSACLEKSPAWPSKSPSGTFIVDGNENTLRFGNMRG